MAEGRNIELAASRDCTGCSACHAACHIGAILMTQDGEGFLRPQIEVAKCVGCGRCVKACPVLGSVVPQTDPDKTALSYAAKSIDEKTRMASSSGGLFHEIAKVVIADGGVVFGCRLEEGTLVAIHAYAETVDSLAPYRRSKYVQSDLRGSFRQCRDFLRIGKKVLFTGTPCQIAGLYGFLGERPENLLTVDLFCHGSPSPAVFEKSKSEIEARTDSRLTSIEFRKKVRGEKWPYVEYHFVNPAKDFRELHYSSPFYQAFINDLCLRPSCHRCRFNGGRSGADITIADFRGLEWERPDLLDETGVSAMIVRSEKAKMFISVLPSIVKTPVRYEQISGNSRSYHNSFRPIPPGRAWFMRKFQHMSLAQCVAMAKDGGVWHRRLAKRFLSKLQAIAKRKWWRG